MPDPSLMQDDGDSEKKEQVIEVMKTDVDQGHANGQTLPEGQALDPDMKIVKNYKRQVDQDSVVPESNKAAVGMQKCQNCQKVIPKAEWREHFKICMMDSKWKEQKLQRIERQKMNSLASSDEIIQNLRRFAS